MGASASIIVGVNDGRSVVGSSVGIVIVVVAVLATVAIVIVVAVVVGGIAVVVEVAAATTSSPSPAAVVASTSSIVPIDALPSIVVVALPSPTTTLSSTMTIVPSSTTTPVMASFQADATSKLHGLAAINDDRKASSSTSRPYFTISPVVGSMMSGTCISYHPSLDPHGSLGIDDDDDIATVELFFDDDDILLCGCYMYLENRECRYYLVAYWRETHCEICMSAQMHGNGKS